jgi:glucosamine-6-phosphate deaminase
VNTKVVDSSAAVARVAADMVLDAASAHAEPVVALPTGRTAILLYDELAWRHTRRPLPLDRVRGFNLDELALPAYHPSSFHSFMELHAWGRTGIVRSRCDIPNGEAPDLEVECRRYEAALHAAGGIDFVVLGLGADGHVAYNLPGPVSLGTHVVRLPDGLAASLDVSPDKWPLRAVTMGIGTLREGRKVLIMASGAAKALAVRALVSGKQDPEWPCSLLAAHADLTVLLDREAAAALP